MINLTRRDTLILGGAALAASLTPALAKSYTEAPVADGITLGGKLSLDGERPSEDVISISKDGHICGTGDVYPNPLQIAEDGGIANGIVALKSVEAGKPWKPAQRTPRVVQRACVFTPFVQIAPKGATLTVVNEDPLLHNIHAYEQIKRARRTLFNIAQPARGQIDTAVLKMRRGSIVEIDCDAHNWMSAWIYTSEHPYVAVTNASGVFEITDVPPGDHTLILWHPVLGTREQDIIVTPGETAELALGLGV